MFKIVLLATISSIIVTASLLLILYTVLLLNIYDHRRQLDIFIKDAIVSRNIAFERVKWLNRKYVKVNQFFFFGTKAIHLRDDEPGNEPGSWLSRFISVSVFHKKFFFSSFDSFKAKFLKKIPKDTIFTLYQLFKQKK